MVDVIAKTYLSVSLEWRGYKESNKKRNNFGELQGDE
jgi:hypothetical protein